MKLKGMLLAAVAAAIGYLALAPAAISPQPWNPPRLKDEAARNNALSTIERLAHGLGVGPEGVSLDSQGRLYTGFDDGRVMRFLPDGSRPELLGNTGGRPWGIYAYPDGSAVLIADPIRGLLRLRDGQVEVLASEADGRPFRQTDDVTMASDGQVYFTDASSRHGIAQMMDGVLEHASDGRLLRYDPGTGSVTVLLDQLHVANGIALGPEEAYLLVAETLEYRVWRFWLKGPKAGSAEVVIENLPGFPDNVSFNGRDGFWLALFAPRDPVLDAAMPYPALRKLISRIPPALLPKAAKRARVLKLDLDGKVVLDLQDDGPDAYAPITSVREAGGWLYFGSIEYPALGRMPVP